jgi:hypothetical protein
LAENPGRIAHLPIGYLQQNSNRSIYNRIATAASVEMKIAITPLVVVDGAGEDVGSVMKNSEKKYKQQTRTRVMRTITIRTRATTHESQENNKNN